jgi:lipoprotein NlpD
LELDMPHHDRFPRLAALTLAVTAVAAAGCAAPPPAPIVSRTPPTQQAQAPRPAPAPAPAPAARPQQPAQPTVQTAPIRSGQVESRSIDGQAAPSAQQQAPAATTRTEPRGTKAPYSDATMAEMRRSDAAPPMANAAPRLEQPARPAAEASAADGSAFAWPGGGKLMQTFEQSSRRGIVLEGAPGDDVLAAADGRVIFSGAGPRDYGNLVIVKHENDLLSVYAHNRSLAVKEGQTVKRGQKIAEVGDSGAPSPRLHFEIRQQGKPVDPMRFLPRR